MEPDCTQYLGLAWKLVERVGVVFFCGWLRWTLGVKLSSVEFSVQIFFGSQNVGPDMSRFYHTPWYSHITAAFFWDKHLFAHSRYSGLWTHGGPSSIWACWLQTIPTCFPKGRDFWGHNIPCRSTKRCLSRHQNHYEVGGRNWRHVSNTLHADAFGTKVEIWHSSEWPLARWTKASTK